MGDRVTEGINLNSNKKGLKKFIKKTITIIGGGFLLTEALIGINKPTIIGDEQKTEAKVKRQDGITLNVTNEYLPWGTDAVIELPKEGGTTFDYDMEVKKNGVWTEFTAQDPSGDKIKVINEDDLKAIKAALEEIGELPQLPNVKEEAVELN